MLTVGWKSQSLRCDSDTLLMKEIFLFLVLDTSVLGKSSLRTSGAITVGFCPNVPAGPNCVKTDDSTHSRIEYLNFRAGAL